MDRIDEFGKYLVESIEIERKRIEYNRELEQKKEIVDRILSDNGLNLMRQFVLGEVYTEMDPGFGKLRYVLFSKSLAVLEQMISNIEIVVSLRMKA